MGRTALIDGELWEYIPDYESVYGISSHGRVFSYPRTESVASSRTGGHHRYRAGKFLTPKVGNAGYSQIGLYLNGKCKRHLVHRLVAKAFIVNPDNLKEVNHIDGDKLNNHYSNLEWSTRKLNSLHSTQILKKNRGENNSFSLLTEQQVLEIKDLLLSGHSQKDIAAQFNVTNHAIYRIHRGFNWQWLTGFDRKEAVCLV